MSNTDNSNKIIDYFSFKWREIAKICIGKREIFHLKSAGKFQYQINQKMLELNKVWWLHKRTLYCEHLKAGSRYAEHNLHRSLYN